MQERETIYERISELRKDKGLTQKGLCEIAGITTTQLNRIERGITGTVSSDALIKLSKALNVSADYLLGLTPISSPKNYDISQLGLSEGAIKTIIAGKADIHVLNVLLENAKFRELMRIIRDYFMDSISAGVMARNELMNLATSSLVDYIKDNPAQKNEVQKDIRLIKSSKLNEYEAEIEKIKNVFISILKEIKKEIDDKTKSGRNVDTAMLQQMISDIQEKKPKSVEEVSEIVANMVKHSAHLDDENTELYRRAVEQIIASTGKQK